MPRSYSVDGEIFDIPDEEVDGFLVDFPNASEVESFTVGKDTFDIPVDQVPEFKVDFPDASPLFKKKEQPESVPELLLETGAPPTIGQVLESYKSNPIGDPKLDRMLEGLSIEEAQAIFKEEQVRENPKITDNEISRKWSEAVGAPEEGVMDQISSSFIRGVRQDEKMKRLSEMFLSEDDEAIIQRLEADRQAQGALIGPEQSDILSLRGISEMAGSQYGMMSRALTAGLINPMLGVATAAAEGGFTGSGAEAYQTYNEARNQGKTPEESLEIAKNQMGVGAATGTAEGALGAFTGGFASKAGLGVGKKILAKGGNKAIAKALGAGTKVASDVSFDSAAAGTMQMLSNLAAKKQGIDRDFTEGVSDNMLGEAIFSSGIHVGGGMTNSLQLRKYVNSLPIEQQQKVADAASDIMAESKKKETSETLKGFKEKRKQEFTDKGDTESAKKVDEDPVEFIDEEIIKETDKKEVFGDDIPEPLEKEIDERIDILKTLKDEQVKQTKDAEKTRTETQERGQEEGDVQDADKRIRVRDTEEDGVEAQEEVVYTSKSGNQTVKMGEERLIITDKEGKEVSAPTRRTVIKEYEDQFDYDQGDRVTEIPEAANPDEADRMTIEKTTSPIDLIEIVERQLDKTDSEIASIEGSRSDVIAEGLNTKVDRDSFKRFGDPNKIGISMAKSYFGGEGKGRPLDVIATELTDQTGMNITENDLVDFMEAYPNGPADYVSKRKKNPIATEAVDKFRQLFGFELNDRVIDKFYKRDLRKLEDFYEQDYRSREEFKDAAERYFSEQTAVEKAEAKDVVPDDEGKRVTPKEAEPAENGRKDPVGSEVRFEWLGQARKGKITDKFTDPERGEVYRVQEPAGTKHIVKVDDVAFEGEELKKKKTRKKKAKPSFELVTPESARKEINKLKSGKIDIKEYDSIKQKIGRADLTDKKKDELIAKLDAAKLIATDKNLKNDRGSGKIPLDVDQEINKQMPPPQQMSIVGSEVDAYISDLVKSIKPFAQKYLTSRGYMPESVFRRMIEMDGRTSAITNQIGQTAKNLRKALKAEYGSDVTVKETTQIDKVLKGADINTIPESLQDVVSDMRRQITQLSRRLVDEGIVEGELVNKIQDDLGTYMTRAYKVHQDPKWAEKVPEDIRNRAKGFVRDAFEDQNLTDDQVDGLIDEILYSKDAPISILAGGSIGSRNMDVLKKRKDIAPEIRELMGEYTDPLFNYANSITKMASLIERTLFLQDVKKQGMDKFLFEKPTKGYHIQLGGAETAASKSPLKGLYTSPEIADALENFDKSAPGSDAFRLYMKINGIVKLSKTVGSLMTHIRNVLGNLYFVTSNVHFQGGKASDAIKTVANQLGKLDKKEFADKYAEYLRLGIVQQSARAGELKDIISDATKAGMESEKVFDSSAKRVTKKTLKAIEDLYQSEDDVFKIYAFENELARYKKAYPDMPKDQLEKKVAKIVMDTYPTYSMVPEAVKMFRRTPLVGTFVSFPAEVIRTTYQTASLIKKELSDPATKKIGAQRLAGFTTAMLAVTAASTAARYMYGISDDQDDEVRRYLAPWSKNSEIVYLGPVQDGKTSYIDMGYTDPHSYLKKPVYALLQGEDLEKAGLESLKEIYEPFLGEELLASKLLDISRNTKDNGGKVYNEQDALPDRLADQAAYLANALEPGTVSSFKRIFKGIHGDVSASGRKYDPAIEITALLSGHRVQELDFEQAFSFKARNFSKAILEAKQIYTSVKNRKGTVTQEEKDKAYERANKSLEKLFKEMSKDYDAAINAGADNRVLRRSMKDNRISGHASRQITRGSYKPLKP